MKLIMRVKYTRLKFLIKISLINNIKKNASFQKKMWPVAWAFVQGV